VKDTLKESRDTRIVQLCINRSIHDIVVIEFINFIENLPIGYFFASQEDHTEIKIMNLLYKFAGVFLPKRD